jgi:hypothetical protein
MAFGTYIYEDDSGTTSWKIRLDTDQAILSGAVKGASTTGVHCKVNVSRRAFGMLPRFISVSRAEGVAGEGKVHQTRLAICTKTAYDAITDQQAVSINGISYAVVGKTGEKKR